MKRIRTLSEIEANDRRGALTIGNFDGVHRGHAELVEQLVAHARLLDGPAIVFTFDPHPAKLIRPQQVPPALTPLDRKCELLAELGVDAVVAYPTNRELLELSPDEFFEAIVIRSLSARAIFEGPNFQFGRNRTGTVGRLAELCELQGVTLKIVQPVEIGSDGVISSSRIRSELTSGAVECARRMLGRPYSIRGSVIRGDRRGRSLGFPTANLTDVETLLPKLGVYAGCARYEGGEFAAAIHVGPNPTFSDSRPKTEVHLIGFSGSLYGKWLEVDFLARLRDIHTFDNPKSLTQQLHVDVAMTMEVFRSTRLDGAGKDGASDCA